MSEKYDLPCVDCIAFAMCNSAYNNYKITREPQYLILSKRCRMIKEWLYEESDDVDIRLRRVFILYKYFDKYIMEGLHDKEKNSMS